MTNSSNNELERIAKEQAKIEDTGEWKTVTVEALNRAEHDK